MFSFSSSPWLSKFGIVSLKVRQPPLPHCPSRQGLARSLFLYPSLPFLYPSLLPLFIPSSSMALCLSLFLSLLPPSLPPLFPFGGCPLSASLSLSAWNWPRNAEELRQLVFGKRVIKESRSRRSGRLRAETVPSKVYAGADSRKRKPLARVGFSLARACLGTVQREHKQGTGARA